jgi:very-short-patch-repair endonuclease
MAVWGPMPVRGTGDAEVARIAARQHGVVSQKQLAAAGLTRHAITHRLAKGRLFRVHRGVYLVGRPSGERLTAEWAAILSCDGHAVLSHGTAAALWGLIPTTPDTISLTAVGRDLRSRRGLEIHRASALDRSDVRLRHGLPVTGAARTLIDLAACCAADELEQAVAEARAQRRVTDRALQQAMDRAGGRKGVAALRALLDGESEPALTRSWFERRFLGLIRSAQLPPPLTNVRLLGFEADFYWPAQRLVVETDGERFHGHRLAFERDRRRDQILLAAGYRVMRVTMRQLRTEPVAVIARLAMALQAAAA